MHPEFDTLIWSADYFIVPPGNCEAVRLLLSKGVDVEPVNFMGTPLHLAASQGQDQVMKILLEHGADVSN